MSSQWEIYASRVGDHPASVRIDMAYTNQEFRPDFLNTMLYVWVKLQAADSNGLTTEAEAPKLFEIEDRLVEFLGAEYGAVPVGVVTTAGRREFYFYGESADQLHEELQPVFHEFPDYSFQLGYKQDSEWEHYFHYLLPSPIEWRWMQDLKIVTQLEEHGDPLTPRPVQHWLYFQTAAAREQVKQAVLQQEFAVDGEPDAPNAFVLVISRTDAVDPDSIHQVTARLMMLALDHDGDYDGWETQVLETE